jgi:hypothetical protein
MRARRALEMAIVYTGRMNIPNYTGLSSDIVAGALPGAQPGMIVFISDTLAWYIVRADLQLVPYSLPVEVTVSSDIELGSVHLDQQLTDSVEIAPTWGSVAVGALGTAQPLMGTEFFVASFTLLPKSTNTGEIYFGDASVDRVTSKQFILPATGSPSIVIDAPIGNKLDLNKFFIDAEIINDGVDFMYLR